MTGLATKKEEWISFAEAWQIATENAIEVKERTFRLWVEENKYGIVAGKFGGQVVVERKSVPKVVPFKKSRKKKK